MKPLPWWTFPLVAGTVVWCGVLLPYWLDGQEPLRTWMLPWLPVAVLAPVAGFRAFQASVWVRWRFAGVLLAAAVAAAVLSSRMDYPGTLTAQAVLLGTVHLPVFLAGTALWAYLQSAGKEDGVDAVRHALSVAALTAGLLAIGGVLIALTVGLLYVVDATEGQIETTLIHVATWGLTSSVFFGHALWLRFPGVFDRILPAVARLFFPVFFALEAAFLVALGIFVYAEVRSADGSAARRTLNRLLAGVWLWSAVWAVGVGVGVEVENEVEDEIEVGGVGVGQITH
jgi:hypothetical protein